MKTTALRIALAASMAATLPALSADDVKPAPPPPSALMDAVFSALRELQQADSPKLDVVARLDRVAAFRHGPETSAKLAKVFGNDHPYKVTRTAAPNGQLAYGFVVSPLHYTAPDGGKTEWSEMNVNALLDKSRRNMTINGSWASIDVHEKDGHFAVRDMTLAGKQKLGYAGIWFGSGRFDVGSIGFDNDTPGAGMAMEGLRADFSVTERPKAVDIGYSIGIKSIAVAGERVEDMRLAMRAIGIDKPAMAAFKTAGEKMNATSVTPQQQAEAIKPILKLLGKAAIARGASLVFDDISARYHGHTASIRGRVNFDRATAADLDAPPMLLKKLAARFEVKVPVALVREIATAVARKQAGTQQQAPATEEQVASIAQTLTDVVVGKMLNLGYARIERDVLVSTVEFRNGVLTANGKKVDLPQVPAPAQQARADAQVLQARRVADSCRLPDFPEDVVRNDQPLTLSMRFTVGADGNLRNVAMAARSQSPAYDEAVLAAMATCRYIPALANGKPVEVPMTWDVVRAPGTVRP